ncbi:MAG: PAS domain S-box protein, partial [Coriobacteriia bacterium]
MHPNKVDSLFKMMMDTTPDLVWLKDASGMFLACNLAHTRLLGVPEAEIIGKTDYDFYDSDIADSFRQNDLLAMEADSPRANEEWITYADDGHRALVETVKMPMRDEDGRLVGVLGIAREITELRAAQEALRESEEKFRTVADCTYDWEAWSAPDGTYLYVSPSCERITGHAVAEFMADSNLSVRIAHPDDRSKAIEHFGQTADEAHGQDEELEYRIVTPDGETRWISHWCTAVHGKDGQWLGRRASNRDITDRKLVENALKASEENFRAFFDTVDDMVVVGSTDGKIVYSNPAVSTKLGYSPAEILTMQILDLNPTDRRAEAEAVFAAMLAGVRDSRPLPLQAKSGVLVPVEAHVWLGKWNGEDCVFDVSRDLTTEREALQKFDSLFSSSPAPMAVSEMPGQTFTDVNDAFVEAVGYSREEILGKTRADLRLFVQPEKQQELAVQLLTQGRISDCELKVRRKDGTLIDGLFSGELIRSQERELFLTVMVDITALKRAEQTEHTLASMIDVIGSISGMRDPYTADHQHGVSKLAAVMARDLGLSEADVSDIRMAGLMLDIGKISVPSEILSKPFRLSASEFELIKTHAESGHSIIASAHMDGPI